MTDEREDYIEDELTEQMITAVQGLKEQFSATIQTIEAAHKKEQESNKNLIREKDAMISELSSQVSTLKSEMLKLAEKIETQSNADLLKKENDKLKSENRRITGQNENLFLSADKAIKIADSIRPLLGDLRSYTEAVEDSNRAVRVELSEETRKAAEGILEPIRAINEEARQGIFFNAINKWLILILLVLYIGSAAFVYFKLF